MNYLVDTNIFLEILLGQAGRKKCEAFLQGENGEGAGRGKCGNGESWCARRRRA